LLQRPGVHAAGNLEFKLRTLTSLGSAESLTGILLIAGFMGLTDQSPNAALSAALLVATVASVTIAWWLRRAVRRTLPLHQAHDDQPLRPPEPSAPLVTEAPFETSDTSNTSHIGDATARPARRDLQVQLLQRYRAAMVAVSMAMAGFTAYFLLHNVQAQPLIVASMLCVTALGTIAVVGDRVTMLTWLLALGVVPSLAVLATSHATSLALGLGGLLACAVGSFMAVQLRKLLMRAWRVRLENAQLVSRLREQVVLVEHANQEKSRFLGAASHDLRQPMHALGLFAAALEKNLRGSQHHPMVTNMARAVDSLEQSFSAMLDISKLDAGVVQTNVQTFPIRDVFRRLHLHAAGLADEKGLSLRFKPGGKYVTSDPHLLERILSNLVQNALRYTPEGGVTVVARSRTRVDHDGVRTHHTSVEVWDTGIGIVADELPNIFKEFYQVGNTGRDRARGLGMGLAIVSRLVALLGHALEVQSTPGRGTVVRLLLRASAPADIATPAAGVDTLPAPADADKTVLVIDDEEPVRVGMRNLLESWGYDVLLAGTIDEACHAVKTHNGVVDMIVSDLRLSGGEDGIDAIRLVRESYGAPLPAVLVTGDTSPEQVKRAHDSGHRVLFKPVRTRELYAALRAVA
jgi:two-component system, sensor histidine kinase